MTASRREGVVIIFFFFSSRRRHTRCLSDWSSDVCSSDLTAEDDGDEAGEGGVATGPTLIERYLTQAALVASADQSTGDPTGVTLMTVRSEERRVGKEGRSRWSPCH